MPMIVLSLFHDLSGEQKQRILDSYPKEEIQFARINPRSPDECMRLCERLKREENSFLVLGPMIIEETMRAGITHVMLTPTGMMELTGVKPELRDYKPA